MPGPFTSEREKGARLAWQAENSCRREPNGPNWGGPGGMADEVPHCGSLKFESRAKLRGVWPAFRVEPMAVPRVQGRELLVVSLLGVAVVGSYRAGLGIFFVNEDFTWLWHCRVQGMGDWFRLLSSDVMEGSYSWRPLLQLAFGIQEAWFGWNPTPMRWQALTWHLVTTVVLYLWLAARVGTIPALAGTCLFAVHPLQVESLVWASALGGPMSTAFLTLSLVVALSSRMWLASAGLLLLSLGAHESALLLLFVLPAAWLFFQRREQGQTAARAAHFAACFVAAGVFFGYRWLVSPAALTPPASAAQWFQQGGATDVFLRMGGRVVGAGAALVGSESLLVGSAIWAALCGSVAWTWWRGEGRAVWGLIWFALALLPYSGTFFGLAPRYFHLPLFGLAIAAAVCLATFLPRMRTLKTVHAVPVAVALTFAWCALWHQAIDRELGIWRERGERTRQLLVEVKTLVPQARSGERFAFAGLGELRMRDGVFVFGLEHALRLLYRDPTIRVVFLPLGAKGETTVQLVFSDGHLWRVGETP